MLRGLRFRQLTGRAKGSSRNVRHKEPIRHTLLEVPDHGRLGSRDRDCEPGTVCATAAVPTLGSAQITRVSAYPVFATETARRSAACAMADAMSEARDWDCESALLQQA